MMIDCVSCERPFDPKSDRRRYGLKDECPTCGRNRESRDGVRRHIGLQAGAGINKAGNIALFRNPSEHMEKFIRSLNKGRFAANTGLGIGATSTQAAPSIYGAADKEEGFDPKQEVWPTKKEGDK